MTPIELIEKTREATQDTEREQQTWKDAQYLGALNEARALLFSQYPESRVTAAVGLTAYAETTEANLSEDLTEDAVYFVFFVEYMAYKYFVSSGRDTAHAAQATEHKKGYLAALSPSIRRG